MSDRLTPAELALLTDAEREVAERHTMYVSRTLVLCQDDGAHWPCLPFKLFRTIAGLRAALAGEQEGV